MLIRTRILLNYLALAVLPTFAIGVTIYSNAKQQLEQEYYAHLDTIAGLHLLELQRVLDTKNEDDLSDTDWAAVRVQSDSTIAGNPVRLRIVKRVGRDIRDLTGAGTWASVRGAMASRPAYAGSAAWRALDGERGSGPSSDEAGDATLSAWRYAPSVGWGLVVSVKTEDAMQQLAAVKTMAFVIAVAIFGVLGMVSIAIAQSITDPLNQVVAATVAIGDGDFDVRVEADVDDEVEHLVDSVNTMAGRLAELNQRVEARTTDLEASNEALEAFGYSVSHDLRAPLRAMDGFSQILLDDYREQLDERAADYLARVRAGAQRMGRLIDDMLGLARITQQVLRSEAVDLATIARDVVATLRATEPDRDVEFVSPQTLPATGDPSLLEVVLGNLLGNAWKFTEGRPAARIELGVTEHDGQREYHIGDNGVGFDPAYAAKLFQPFRRLHSREEFPGTGVGLATVRRILRRHGGDVWADAEVDVGATFHFRLHGGPHPHSEHPEGASYGSNREGHPGRRGRP